MNWPNLVCPDQIGGTPRHPVLLGNRCRECGEPFFPAAKGCTRCTATNLEPLDLGREGRIWSWTVQNFEPKAPFDGQPSAGDFQPFGLGYVEMACGAKVEARLAGHPSAWSIGLPVRLVLQSYRRDDAGQDFFTYAFEESL